MFNDVIAELTLTSEIANRAMENITGGTYQNDVTMLAVARLLLYPRAEKLHINVLADGISRGMDREEKEPYHAELKRQLLPERSDELRVVYFNTASRADFDYLAEHGLEVFEGYSAAESSELAQKIVSHAIASQRRILLYHNPDNRTAILLINRMTIATMHALASIINVLVPWCFSGKPYSDSEKELMVCLGYKKDSKDEFVGLIEKLTAEVIDLQSEAKKMYLEGFERANLEARKKSVEQNLEHTRREIKNYINTLNSLYERMELQNAELTGLVNGVSGVENVLMDYFLSNKSLYVERRDGSRIYYYVARELFDFDIDLFKTSMKNSNGMIYSAWRYNDGRITKDEYLDLLRAIFEKGTVRVKFVSKWYVGFGCGIQPCDNAEFPAQFNDYLPNPHLQYHGCTGGFSSHLSEAAAKHDYVMAVDITSAETGNLNLNDSVVFPKFLRDVLQCRTKAFVLPDGSNVTLEEAVTFVKSEPRA